MTSSVAKVEPYEEAAPAARRARRLGPLSGAWRVVADHWRIHRDPVAWARSQGVRVGERCRLLGVQRTTFGSEPYLIRLGDHVTITQGVQFITHDGGVWVFRDSHPDVDVFAPIVVGSNVFIGAGSILMPGAVIGDDVVVGAGSVVTGEVPSGCVAVGAPARPVRSVQEYWRRLEPQAQHIRSRPEAEKRSRLLRQFEAVLSGPDEPSTRS